MAELEPLGILGLEGVHYYVRDLERSERFYVDHMDFMETAESGPTLSEEGHQRSRVFRAGEYVSKLRELGAEVSQDSLAYGVFPGKIVRAKKV